ncbi:hypothetical protein PoB_002374800 [Plakobranchus ocellatus]|uniref:Uncharacterized protein n=1 Tax=Plakobranchus ocellatus TaxID=259542 RepID=A0AAV3ZRT6_9GAST|nr:hypothetical protein PoB_002374800 [Plakobranchus ocellatus]
MHDMLSPLSFGSSLESWSLVWCTVTDLCLTSWSDRVEISCQWLIGSEQHIAMAVSIEKTLIFKLMLDHQKQQSGKLSPGLALKKKDPSPVSDRAMTLTPSHHYEDKEAPSQFCLWIRSSASSATKSLFSKGPESGTNQGEPCSLPVTEKQNRAKLECHACMNSLVFRASRVNTSWDLTRVSDDAPLG